MKRWIPQVFHSLGYNTPHFGCENGFGWVANDAAANGVHADAEYFQNL